MTIEATAAAAAATNPPAAPEAAVSPDAGSLRDNGDAMARRAARAAADQYRAANPTPPPIDPSKPPPEVPESIAAAPEAAPPAPAPAVESALSQLQRAMNERKAAQQAREGVRSQVEAEIRQKFDAERAALEESFRTKAREELLGKFKSAPVDAVKELGIDGAEFVGNLVKQASPEAAAHRELAELKAQIAALKGEFSKPLEELQAARKHDAAERERLATAHAHQQFLAALSPEKAPHARAVYGDDASVMRRAQEVANAYCEATGETHCPYDQLVEHLESEAREAAPKLLAELEGRQSALSKLLKKLPGVAVGNATQAERASPRTLSAQGASERRASPRPVAQLTPEEERKALVDVARAAAGKGSAA